MIRPVLIIMSVGVSQDVVTNTVTIFSVIEQVRTEGYPLVVPGMAVVYLERDETDDRRGQARVDMELDGEPLFEEAVEIDFGDQAPGLLYRLLLRFEGFLIPHAGKLRVRVTVGNASMESYPVAAVPVGTGQAEVSGSPSGSE